MPTEDDDYHTHQIEITEVRFSRIAGRVRKTIRELRAGATALRARAAQHQAIPLANAATRILHRY